MSVVQKKLAGNLYRNAKILRLSVTRNESTYDVSKAQNQRLPQSKYFPPKNNIMLPPGTFANKVAFITGGGTGLGKGMATTLSHLGAAVFITSRRLPVLEATAKEIGEKTGNPVIPFPADVRDPEAVRKAVDECQAKLGLPHVIINNAAGNFVSPTERLSPNAWRTITDIVLNGTANVTLDIGKRLIKAKQGAAFLAITATYIQSGSGFVAPSAAGKAGVAALSRSLASEWGRYGMRFNCISPGAVPTEGAGSRLNPNNEGGDEERLRNTPIGRNGTREELANFVSFLVSDYSNWLTGEVINYDGGTYVYSTSPFNKYSSLEPEQWDAMEAKIREANKKSKQ